MKIVTFGLVFIASLAANAFTDGVTYSTSYKSDGVVVLSDVKYKGKGIFGSSKSDVDDFYRNICASFDAESISIGPRTEVVATGEDNQQYTAFPFGILVHFNINNPMAFIENGELVVKKVENQSIHSLYTVITCKITEGFFNNIFD